LNVANERAQCTASKFCATWSFEKPFIVATVAASPDSPFGISRLTVVPSVGSGVLA
jgi:hypothetical protein